MFNVGLIAGAPQKLVHLADFFIPVTGDTNVTFTPGGGVTYNSPDGNPAVPGMWWIGSGVPTPGNNYQIRFTLEAGDTPPSPGLALGTWGILSTFRYFYWLGSASGRVRADIRADGGTAILATGRFWRGAYAP